jgi:hypothetical protein
MRNPRVLRRSAVAVRRSANHPLYLAEQRVPRQVAARITAWIGATRKKDSLAS